jgi:uncharacterized membrane protein YdcZ (DUF606 family)
MNPNLNKIASGLAFLIGTMAVFSGGQTLLGKVPDYYVIDWLPLYNYTVGILTVFVTARLIWTSSKLAAPTSITTFSLHAVTMLILQSAYRDVVAMDSVVAMTLRLMTWFVILLLIFLQMRIDKRILEKGES